MYSAQGRLAAQNDAGVGGLIREIDKLSAENQQLRTQLSKPYLRVSPKGGLSVYGLGRVSRDALQRPMVASFGCRKSNPVVHS